MSYLSIALVSCLATLSLASPVARQSDKLPYTIVPCDVAGNFTMLALRNETGLELVTPLALGLNGLAGAEYSLATAGTIDSGDLVAQSFSLNNGAINAYDTNGKLVAVSATVDTSGLLTFIPSGPYVTGAEIYSEMCNKAPVQYPNFIEVYGTQYFFLCQSNTSNEDVVVYNAFEDSARFDEATCYSVYIYFIPS